MADVIVGDTKPVFHQFLHGCCDIIRLHRCLKDSVDRYVTLDDLDDIDLEHSGSFGSRPSSATGYRKSKTGMLGPRGSKGDTYQAKELSDVDSDGTSRKRRKGDTYQERDSHSRGRGAGAKHKQRAARAPHSMSGTVGGELAEEEDEGEFGSRGASPKRGGRQHRQHDGRSPAHQSGTVLEEEEDDDMDVASPTGTLRMSPLKARPARKGQGADDASAVSKSASKRKHTQQRARNPHAMGGAAGAMDESDEAEEGVDDTEGGKRQGGGKRKHTKHAARNPHEMGGGADALEESDEVEEGVDDTEGGRRQGGGKRKHTKHAARSPHAMGGGADAIDESEEEEDNQVTTKSARKKEMVKKKFVGSAATEDAGRNIHSPKGKHAIKLAKRNLDKPSANMGELSEDEDEHFASTTLPEKQSPKKTPTVARKKFQGAIANEEQATDGGRTAKGKHSIKKAKKNLDQAQGNLGELSEDEDGDDSPASPPPMADGDGDGDDDKDPGTKAPRAKIGVHGEEKNDLQMDSPSFAAKLATKTEVRRERRRGVNKADADDDVEMTREGGLLGTGGKTKTTAKIRSPSSRKSPEDIAELLTAGGDIKASALLRAETKFKCHQTPQTSERDWTLMKIITQQGRALHKGAIATQAELREMGDTTHNNINKLVADGVIPKTGQHHVESDLPNEGGKYDGDTNNGKLAGFGTLELPDGHKYSGAFVDNRFGGQGHFEWHIPEGGDEQLLSNTEAVELNDMIATIEAEVRQEVEDQAELEDKQKAVLRKALARKLIARQIRAKKIAENKEDKQNALELRKQAIQKAIKERSAAKAQSQDQWQDLVEAGKDTDKKKTAELVEKYKAEQLEREKLQFNEQRKQADERRKKIEAKKKKKMQKRGSGAAENASPDALEKMELQKLLDQEGLADDAAKEEEEKMKLMIKSYEQELKAKQTEQQEQYQQQQAAMKKALSRRLQKREARKKQLEENQRRQAIENQIKREAIRRAFARTGRESNDIKDMIESSKGDDTDVDALMQQYNHKQHELEKRIMEEYEQQRKISNAKMRAEKRKKGEPIKHYNGQWKDGHRHGAGSYTDENGNKYDGMWSNGNMEGYGRLRLFDGSEYCGNFKANLFHGDGAMLYSNGDRYEGHWANGDQQGHGAYTFTNDEKYIGQWQLNKMHGMGTYVMANGHRYQVNCEKGNVINQKELIPHKPPTH